MNEIAELIEHYGVGVICLAYLIFDSAVNQRKMEQTLGELRDLIKKLIEKLDGGNE